MRAFLHAHGGTMTDLQRPVCFYLGGFACAFCLVLFFFFFSFPCETTFTNDSILPYLYDTYGAVPPPAIERGGMAMRRMAGELYFGLGVYIWLRGWVKRSLLLSCDVSVGNASAVMVPCMHARVTSRQSVTICPRNRVCAVNWDHDDANACDFHARNVQLRV